MFAEALVFVASACQNGQCPPVVASSYYIQVQPPANQVVQTQTVIKQPVIVMKNSNPKVKPIKIFLGWPNTRHCTSGACK